jgi:hypothetical protein
MGIDKLKAGKGRYVKIFINSANIEPVDTIISTARWIADGNGESRSDDGEYSKEEWSRYAFIEVDNFDARTVQQATEQYKQDNIGTKSSVDTQRVRLVDLTNPDANKIKLGDINLKEGKITSVVIDLTTV